MKLIEIVKIYNLIILFYLILIISFTLNENLYWGNGLGDLVFLYISIGLAIVQFIIIISLHVLKKNIWTFFITGTFFLLAVILLTWEFTIGRGAEYPWNGNVFYKTPF